MIAHVVPIQRIRRATTWWSYKVKSTQKIQVGSLVVIPFRGRSQLGVVWEIDDADDKAQEEVREVITHYPLLRQPHRRMVEHMSEFGLLSLSSALYLWLPTGLRKYPLTRPVRNLLDTQTATPPQTSRQSVVITPTQRPHAEADLSVRAGSQFASLFGKVNPTSELQTWFGIWSGAVTVLTGRERAIFAPYSNLQHIIVKDPEDASYWHEQQPYLSLVTAATKLSTFFNASIRIDSNLPPAAATELWGSSATGVTYPSHPVLVDLSKEDLVNETLVQTLQNLSPSDSARLLYNAHDRKITDADGTVKLLPGIESVRTKLTAALGLSRLPHGITIDTRSLFSSGSEVAKLGVMLSLDPLLRSEIFTDWLNGVADIGQLSRSSESVVIQARNQEHPLIHALRNNQVDAYILAEFAKRRVSLLPPFCDLIVCSIPQSTDAPSLLETIHQGLTKAFADSEWKCSEPITYTYRKTERCAVFVTAHEHTRLPVRAQTYLSQLKKPWRVERNPWHVL